MTDIPTGPPPDQTAAPPPTQSPQPSANMVQAKKQVAANIAMAFMNHQQATQQLAQQMVQMMQQLLQQNQAIMDMLQRPRQGRVIRDPQTGDVVGTEHSYVQETGPEISGPPQGQYQQQGGY